MASLASPPAPDVEVLTVPHLRDYAPDQDARVPNDQRAGGSHMRYRNHMDDSDLVLAKVVQKAPCALSGNAYLRAGTRSHLYFEPSQVKAAIVTCGGLCPGLNNVIRELVLSLHTLYGVAEVHGVLYVFNHILGRVVSWRGGGGGRTLSGGWPLTSVAVTVTVAVVCGLWDDMVCVWWYGLGTAM